MIIADGAPPPLIIHFNSAFVWETGANQTYHNAYNEKENIFMEMHTIKYFPVKTDSDFPLMLSASIKLEKLASECLTKNNSYAHRTPVVTSQSSF